MRRTAAGFGLPFLLSAITVLSCHHHRGPTPTLGQLQLDERIVDSQAATLRGVVAAFRHDAVVDVDWGDGSKESLRLQAAAFEISHRYRLVGTFHVEVVGCTPAWGRLRCSSPQTREVAVSDDDANAPVVDLKMPRGFLISDVPHRIAWKIHDPSGLSEVRVDLEAPDGFRTSFRSPQGEFDFGDHGLGNYNVMVDAVDADDDRPGDRAGGPFLNFFVVTADQEGDGVRSHVDNCPTVKNPGQEDRDNDGFGDACDLCPRLVGKQPDADADGVGDPCDNCERAANKAQGNVDGDLLGDACDDDLDNDGLANERERQLGTDERRPDTDQGGRGDGDEVDAGSNPRDGRDDPRPPRDVVNEFVSDRLLVRFAYALPEESVKALAAQAQATVAAHAGNGIYELSLARGTTVERALAVLGGLRGPSEEGHHDEPLVYPVADLLGTFEATAAQDLGDNRPPPPTLGDNRPPETTVDRPTRQRPPLPSDRRISSQAGFASLLDAWQVERGGEDEKGIVVALLDTGLDLEHEDLRGNLWRNADEQRGDANGDGCPGRCRVDDDGDGLADLEDPEVRELLARGHGPNAAASDDDENGYPDDFNGWDFAADSADLSDKSGHGTHVAGVVGAVGDNGTGVAGVMWRTRLMPLKVARAGDGLAPFDAILKALRYAGQNGADVILHSYTITLERPSDDTIANLRAAFGRTGTKHLLHVAAAGNRSRDLSRKRPVTDPTGRPIESLQNLVSDSGFFVFPVSLRSEVVVSVAALDETGETLARFSNRGTDVVMMAAPGTNLLSTLPGNGYGFRSGTSLAAAYMAGMSGLLLERYPQLRGRPTEVLRFLDERGEEIGNPQVITSLFYQLTHPPVLTGTLYDETPFRFPVGFCGHNTYDSDLVDLDGDGDLDILEVNGNPGSGTNNVHLYSNDGSGRFTNASADLGAAAAGLNVLAADHADVEHDGDVDVVLASFTPPAPDSNRKEILLLNRGGAQNGEFDNGSDELPDLFDISRDVDFCDFDGDTFADLFVTNAGEDRVWRNVVGTTPTCVTTAVDCFQDMTSTWLAGAPVGDGHNSQCVDVDGDGDLDVVTANLDTGSPAGGDVLLLNRINAVEAAFVDGTTTWTLPNAPDASHSFATAYRLDGRERPGDLDDDSGDGTYGGAGDRFDLVVVRRQHGAGGAPQNNLVVRNLGAAFDDETFGSDDVPGTAPDRLPNVAESSTEAALCDVDGDGDPDLLEANGDANYGVTAQNRFYRNRTDAGVDAGGRGWFADQTSAIGIPVGYLQQSTDVDCGDIDGDTDIDVLFANYGGCPEIYVNRTADATPGITSIAPSSIAVGEMVTIKGSNFGLFQGAAGKVTFGGVDAGTVYHWTPNRITVQVPVGCDGNGTPGTCNGMGVPTPTPKGSQSVVVTTATGKVSAAGSVSILCLGGPPVGGVCPGNLQNFVAAPSVAADGDCTDSPGSEPCLPHHFEGTEIAGFDPRNIKDVEFGDIDDDGDLDVYDVSSPSPRPYCIPMSPMGMSNYFPDRLLLNDGTGRYREQLGPPFLSNRSYDADLADVNNDGFLDMVRGDYMFCAGEDHYFITHGTSPLTFSGGSLGIVPHAYWCEVAPGDVDGDGDLDLLLARASTGVDNVIQINRHLQGGDCLTPNDCFATWDPLVAAPTHCPSAGSCKDDFSAYVPLSHDGVWSDLDGDRDLDIFLGGGTGFGGDSGVNAAFLNRLVETGEMFFEQVPIPNAAIADPTVGVVAADFNGDGRPDIHLANSRNGGPAADQVDKLYLNLGRVDCGSPADTACPDGLSCPACPGPSQVVCNRICWRDGTPQLPETLSTDPQLRSYGSDYGDVDGDGDLDFIATTEYHGDSHLMLNQGFKTSVSMPLTWTACPSMSGVTPCPALPGTGFPEFLMSSGADLAATFGDFDNDGDLDIIWGDFEPAIGPDLLENKAVP